MKEGKVLVRFRLNGKPVETFTKPNDTLLNLLRRNLGITSVKRGCEVGECGACTVLLDGNPVVSCLILAPTVEGKEITTIEGISKEGELHPLQQAFIKAGAVQCGFCTPGMILTAKALLDKNPNPSLREIKEAIQGNLCRCTGYTKIIQAIQLASKEIKSSCISD
ncbi:MAG TPA: (2Fe-2S)-binding protein [Thermoplasmata archaeon]|nr:(2Fe-2S)-binding protein [Thermoplasmata archaeon]